MSVDYDDEEADRILAAADVIIADEPRPTPEILDAVASSTKDAGGTEGMAPREDSGGERAFARGPVLVLHIRMLFALGGHQLLNEDKQERL